MATTKANGVPVGMDVRSGGVVCMGVIARGVMKYNNTIYCEERGKKVDVADECFHCPFLKGCDNLCEYMESVHAVDTFSKCVQK